MRFSDRSKDSQLLTVKDVAWRLNVSVRTVHRLISRGDLQTTQIGGSRRIAPDELERYIDGGSRPPSDRGGWRDDATPRNTNGRRG